MAAFPLRRYVPVLIHVLGWGLLTFMFLLYQPLTRQVTMPTEWWINQAVVIGLLVGVFYLNALIWVPQLVFRNRMGWYVLLLAGVVAFIWLMHRQVDSWLNLPEVMDRFFHPNEPARPRRLGGRNRMWDTFIILLSLFTLGISTSLTVVQKWQKDGQARQALEKEKVSTELSFLKAQINPHFFFNTLNNIYALTLIDGDTAREAIHRLSRMMRYVLYDSQAGTVLLSQELAFVQDYIQLMQLRLTDKVTISFEQPTPIRDVLIAPMLLLPFVENAFKHGVNALLPSRIWILIRQPENRLEMEVRNTNFPEKTGAVGQSLEASNGIGLVNTRRRLDLMYPDQYELEVIEQTPENEYLVRLKIEDRG
ncbi:MAG: histidine kinase [Cytophagaceae bacterium]|nr:histidine kinase [Cytophagaceae bacterium]